MASKVVRISKGEKVKVFGDGKKKVKVFGKDYNRKVKVFGKGDSRKVKVFGKGDSRKVKENT